MKVVLIGAGNVGHHLGQRLHEVGVDVMQVFSRKKEKAKKLATKINSTYATSIEKISSQAELYILAVRDDAINEVSKKMLQHDLNEKLIVHTSGATPQSIFKKNGFKRHGVFYPLQTFSLDKKPNFQEIPICVDASSDDDLARLKRLAERIGSNAYHIPDDKRAVIHVAAVFANNFSNYLYGVADDILKGCDVPLEILLPLMKETVNKLEKGSPGEMQTGPANRGDDATIFRHMAYLERNPEYRAIYSMLTKGIINKSKYRK